MATTAAPASAWCQAAADPAAWTSAATSLVLAIARMIVVMPISIFLAWALTRTNMPLRGLMEGLVISHIFLPFLPLAMAWAVLASPRAGLLNVMIRGLLHLPITSGPINILSYGGLVWLSALGIPTFLHLLMGPAFRSMDASLEESARMSGLGPFGTLRRITVPLLAPSILGAGILAFVLALQSFEPELILGQPANIYVFSTQIFHYIDGFSTPRYGSATALSTVFLVVTFALVLIQNRVLGNRQFTTVSGRGYRVQPLELGRWRFAVFGLVLGQVNHLPASVLHVGESALGVRVPAAGDLTLPLAVDGIQPGDDVVLAFRSADVEIVQDATGAWPGTLALVVYLGGRNEYVVKVGMAEIRSERGDPGLRVGAQVAVRVPLQAIRVWPATARR